MGFLWNDIWRTISAASFALAAFDNFDHLNRNSLSGALGTYDTAITFWENNVFATGKPAKPEVSIETGEKLECFPCQKIVTYEMSKAITIPKSFAVDEEIAIKKAKAISRVK